MRGIVLVKTWAATQKGIAMKLLMIAVIMLTANAGMAFGEGRYQVAPFSKLSAWLIIDTKTGQTRYCLPDGGPTKPPKCSPWTEK